MPDGGTMVKVFVNGNQGTTGLKLLARLEKRGGIKFLTVAETERKNPEAVAAVMNESDITFLCLPDAAAVEAVPLVKNENVKIIDASTAHRTAKGWCYGFPELGQGFRDAVAGGKRIAVPGCHATGFLALVYPLIKMGVLPKDYPVACHSLTGYSGGGKSMIAEYEAGGNVLLESPRQYALTQQHKHLKEMQSVSGLEYYPVFNPIVSGYYSGMVVSVPLYTRLLKGPPYLKQLHEAFSEFYGGAQLIDVLSLSASEELGGFLPANYLAGRDGMKILVSGNDDRVTLYAVFDNLGKGASSAAVQCMNIMTGCGETSGLII